MLAANRLINSDKSFYFSDPTYSDLRELICHERPILFVLHYYFGLEVPYALLLDRFKFMLTNEAELTTDSDLLARYFNKTGITEPVTISSNGLELTKILSPITTRDVAIIVPLTKLVAGVHLASSVLVELDVFNCQKPLESRVLVTSLRGDDFYIRREMPLEHVLSNLALTNGKADATILKIPKELLSQDLQEREKFKSFIAQDIEGFSATISKLPPKRPHVRSFGAAALRDFVQARRCDLQDYRDLLQGGFQNVLLAKVLWPMTFCYLPYVISRRRLAERNRSDHDDPILQMTHRIIDLSGLATNLGFLWGKEPSDHKAERFFSTLDQIVENYAILDPTSRSLKVRDHA